MRKYSELLTIPVALIFMVLYNWLAGVYGIHTMTFEKVEKVVVGTVIFLIMSGLARFFYILVFPSLYKYFDPSFIENYKWTNLTRADRTKYSLLLYCALLIAFAMVVNGL